jgi:hypothetical protein
MFLWENAQFIIDFVEVAELLNVKVQALGLQL